MKVKQVRNYISIISLFFGLVIILIGITWIYMLSERIYPDDYIMSMYIIVVGIIFMVLSNIIYSRE